MVNALLTIFWGLVVLLILVVVHELGHFVAARSFGTRVTEFMIGMPGPNIGIEHNGCRYGITCIPLGGYNRITGMEGGEEDENLEQVLAYTYRHGAVDVEHVATGCGISQDDAEFALTMLDGWGSINKPGRSNKTDKWCAPKTDALALGEARQVEDPKALLDAERAQTYRGMSFPKRLVTLFAGPLMNVIFAVVLLLVALCGIGMDYTTTTIESFSDGSPAIAAGLQEGDTITSVDGTEVISLGQVRQQLTDKKAGDTVQVGYTRDGVALNTSVTLIDDGNGNALLGVLGATGKYRLGVIEALQSSWDMLVSTVQAYANLFNPSTAAETVSQTTSMVGVSVVAKQAADTGVFNLLIIMAVVSLSLGVVNLLPVPPLDGGKIVTECIERVAHRPVPVKVINATTIVFIALMMLFFFYMVHQDVVRFILPQ